MVCPWSNAPSPLSALGHVHGTLASGGFPSARSPVFVVALQWNASDGSPPSLELFQFHWSCVFVEIIHFGEICCCDELLLLLLMLLLRLLFLVVVPGCCGQFIGGFIQIFPNG